VDDGSGGVPGGDHSAHEQLLRALIERLNSRRSPGRLGSRLGLAGGKLTQRGLA
jgi:hypothetical protein